MPRFPTVPRTFAGFQSEPATERVIAFGRLALSIGGLFAIYADPAQRPGATLEFVILGAYVAFALACLVIFRRPVSAHWTFLSHATEIGLVCLIIGYTEGPTSPFFVYFTFVLLVAALRWRGPGVLVTGAVLCAVLIGFSLFSVLIEVDRADVDRLIIRNIYLLVASGLFAFLGDELGRSHERSERLRLAQELHDGVLQTLTAARLKLHELAATDESDRDQILCVAAALEGEQRQIRSFVERTRQNFPEEGSDPTDFTQDLNAHLKHLRDLWGCHIELVARQVIPVRSDQNHSIKLILAESVANAVTHGKASAITIDLRREAELLRLIVKDNGAGLAGFSGRYRHDELAAGNIGPRSLRERIARLGGSLSLDTSSEGLELEFSLPR